MQKLHKIYTVILMKSKNVVIIGHKDIGNLSETYVDMQIENLIRQGYTTFFCGGMGYFDILCAKTVHLKKSIYPDVKCLLIIPYLSFSISSKDIYDEIIYPEGFEDYYFKKALIKRNKYMVDNASLAFCYVCHTFGGAFRTYNYAEKQGLKINNIGTLKND